MLNLDYLQESKARENTIFTKVCNVIWPLPFNVSDLPNIPDAIQNCEELISLNFSNNPIGRYVSNSSHLHILPN